MKDVPLISVVVPVYKVEPYVRQCIDSILAQTYSNLDIILVDDGSPDKCPEICDDYAKQDGRIRVIHKPNGGLSSARNAGIDIARGEYIAFIDSDDYVSETYIEQLWYTLSESGADMSCSLVTREERALDHVISRKYKIYTAEKALRRVIRAFGFSAYGRLYKTSAFAVRSSAAVPAGGGRWSSLS